MPELLVLHRDERVLSAFGSEPGTDEDTREFLARKLAHWHEHGFGIWMFRDPAATFIGRCGIHRWRAEVELGYIVKPSFWDQGYGTEMATADFTMRASSQSSARARDLLRVLDHGGGASGERDERGRIARDCARGSSRRTRERAERSARSLVSMRVSRRAGRSSRRGSAARRSRAPTRRRSFRAWLRPRRRSGNGTLPRHVHPPPVAPPP